LFEQKRIVKEKLFNFIKISLTKLKNNKPQIHNEIISFFLFVVVKHGAVEKEFKDRVLGLDNN